MSKIKIYTQYNKQQSDLISNVSYRLGFKPPKNEKLKEVLKLKDDLQREKAESQDAMLNLIIDYWVSVGDEIKELITGIEKQKHKRGNKNGKRKD